MIGRKTRVLGEDGEVLAEVVPPKSSSWRATDEVPAALPTAPATHRSSTRPDEVRPPIPGSVRQMASLPGEAQRGRCLQDCQGESEGNGQAVPHR